jgi:hypothetical protein
MNAKHRFRTRLQKGLASAVVLFGAGVSLAGCAQMKDRFDMFAPISPETAAAGASKDGSYRDEYGIVHAYKDQAGTDRPIGDLLSTPIPFGGTK